jgi:hypothetical protein
MRQETVNPRTVNWNLGRIPVTSTNVNGHSPKYGVTLTEIEFGKESPVGSWTGYPYLSLKK